MYGLEAARRCRQLILRLRRLSVKHRQLSVLLRRLGCVLTGCAQTAAVRSYGCVMRGGHGVHLGRNDRVDNLELEVLSDHWYVLRKATFGYRHRDGRVTREIREAYDRGNGVTILLHDPVADTVILTATCLPIYLNGHPDGMLIETAAGLLDGAGRTPRTPSAGRQKRRPRGAWVRCAGCSSCS